MRVFFTNLGCKLNQAETERLARRFQAAGHALATSLDDADLHVVNSCTVTATAARSSRKAAGRGRRRGAKARTVVTGCHATAAPAELARLAGVDLVVPNSDKEDLLERVEAAFPALRARAAPAARRDVGRSRALVAIEDGCDMRCSFCVIPSTRGGQRSRPWSEVVAEVRGLTAAGFPEVVVTGVQISEYRDGPRRLYDLVAALLAESGVRRLRLSSIAPWRFDHRLLDLFADRRLCRHLHLSLQSGSTATLRRMRRPYSALQYRRLVERVRERVPGIAITTDVIVGFPGEDAAEFAESLAFVERLAFARPHIFPFSTRPGTEAAGHPSAVAAAETAARMAAMRQVGEASERAFQRRHLGETLEVAWEAPRRGRAEGLTDNYIRVFALAGAVPTAAGTLSPARLERLERDGVVAIPVAA